MHRIALRFASMLILALALASAASAQQWVANRYIETPGTLSAAHQFDSTLIVTSNGWSTVYVYLEDDSTTPPSPLRSATGVDVCNPCTFTFFKYLKVGLHNEIVAKGGFPAGRPFVAGPLRLTSTASLSYISPILVVSNSQDGGAFELSFEYDHGDFL
jgi:hypothetical protein